jgi:hypothetical protein
MPNNPPPRTAVWKYRGLALLLLAGPLAALTVNLMNVSGTLFFTAYDVKNSREIWKADPSANKPNPAITPQMANASSNFTATTRASVTPMATQRLAPRIVTPTSHPRLWLTDEDLPRLRSWAVSSNPIFQNGIAARAASAKADMDAGRLPTGDNGSIAYENYPNEMYAELFAFMSLISADQATRDDYAQRARTLLMYVMDRAVLGADNGANPAPFRDPRFSINDRSRWFGTGWGLTVDWIYFYLSASDKATIRTVFLRWIGENLNAGTTTDNHPTPIGTTNDPVLVSDPIAVRNAGNNYYTAHMRNIGLMAMSFDAADDADNMLRNYLSNATGAWLYVVDNLMRNDARGGLFPEGFEYSPQTVGYIAQFLLALHTSGNDDPSKFGPQVVLTNNPFWNDHITAYLHSISPVPVTYPDISYLGPLYQPAWYGACSHYYADDPIEAIGPLGIYDYLTGNTNRLAATRWIETNVGPGGAAGLNDRARDGNFFRHDIFYFMLFDPSAAVAPDPRPALPSTVAVSGIGHISGRTSWDGTARWFNYALGWNSIDHQAADANKFEFYRKGEWLTKSRLGYDLDYLASDNHNTLSLQNDAPQRQPDDYRYMLGQRGSQWLYVNSGDPTLVAISFGTDYIYATGDATSLYNSAYESVTDISHASRSIFWLKPDHIVIYDRAESKTANRFKRFWIHSPTQPSISGKLATMTTTNGQHLYTSTLLPTNASISIQTEQNEPSGAPAEEENISYRLLVEAPGGPQSARFLHVLQGADSSVSADTATLIQSTSGDACAGAAVSNAVILFPVNLGAPLSAFTYTVLAGTTRHYLTGLTPNGGYTVSTQMVSGNIQVRISSGGGVMADSSGVMAFGAVAGPVAPTITRQPVSQTVTAGTNVIFGMTATNTGPLSYQWLFNGLVLPGQTNAILNLSALRRTNSGGYSIVVTGSEGSVTSSPAPLRVIVPQRIRLPQQLAGGQWRLLFSDHDGGLLTSNDLANFQVHLSTNLTGTNWLALTNGFMLTNGMILSDDASAVGQPRRFYRVIER